MSQRPANMFGASPGPPPLLSEGVPRLSLALLMLMKEFFLGGFLGWRGCGLGGGLEEIASAGLGVYYNAREGIFGHTSPSFTAKTRKSCRVQTPRRGPPSVRLSDGQEPDAGCPGPRLRIESPARHLPRRYRYCRRGRKETVCLTEFPGARNSHWGV